MTANDYPSFVLSDEDADKLKDAIGVDLSEELRAELEAIVNNYIVAKYFKQVNITRKKMVPPLRADGSPKNTSSPMLGMRRALDKAVRFWSQINNDPETREWLNHYDAELQEMKRGTLQDLMGDIQFHRIWLKTHLGKSEERAEPQKAYLVHLSQFYTRVTDSQATYSADRAGGKDPAFLCLVRHLDGLLPDSTRRGGADTSGAWSKFIDRALNGQTEG